MLSDPENNLSETQKRSWSRKPQRRRRSDRTGRAPLAETMRWRRLKHAASMTMKAGMMRRMRRS